MKSNNVFMMAILLMAGTALQAQAVKGGSQSTDKPAQQQENNDRQKVDRQKVDQQNSDRQNSVKGSAEPKDDYSQLTTADQARKFAEARVAWLEGQVGTLSNDVKKNISDQFNETYSKIRELKEANPNMSRAELKIKADEMLVGTRSKVIGMLNPDQQASLQQWQDSQDRSAMDQAKSRAKDQTEQLHGVVNLTAEQKEKVLELNTNLYKEGREWKQANPGATADDKRNYSREMSLKRMEGYKGILTEEQKAMLVENRKKLEDMEMDLGKE